MNSTAADRLHAHDLRSAARHLVRYPLVLEERDPNMFQLIRRHEQSLDRWFTQRFGYRLQVTADTARLFKTTVIAERRPLMAALRQSRPMSGREHTLLSLALAAASAGASVVSLRDLIKEIRSAAVEADVTITEEPADRRALVTALRWMVQHGIANEMHDRIERYAEDSDADAVLELRPDRVALLPLPVLARSDTVEQLLDRSDQRLSSRAWMRSILLEEPVLYRSDLTPGEWTELRRRLRDEADIFDSMFGLHIEARAEGVSAIDEDGKLTDSRFPRGGTVGHAALLLIDRLTELVAKLDDHQDEEREDGYSDTTRWDVGIDFDIGVNVGQGAVVDIAQQVVIDMVGVLASEHEHHWSKRLVSDPARLTAEILALLQDHRLAQPSRDGTAIRFFPAIWRYGVTVKIEETSASTPTQTSLI